MATTLKLRRGTTAQHATFTGEEGEVTVDTTKDTVVVHDGTTAGGFPLARQDLSNVTGLPGGDLVGTTATQTLTNKTLTSPVINGRATVEQSSSTAYAVTATTPIVGLVAGNTVNMAYFANDRGASFNDGLRIVNYRESTATSIADWTKESFAIERNVDGAGTQAAIRFGDYNFKIYTSNVERFDIGAAGQFGVGGANYGTSGQVLKSQGASSPPVWSDDTGGGMTLLGTLTTTSGSTQELTGLTLTDYVSLFLVWTGISITTGTQSFYITTAGNRFQEDSGGGSDTFNGFGTITLTNGTYIGYGDRSDTANRSIRFIKDTTLRTSSTSILFGTSGTFDAGSILVYGVK